MNLPQLVEQEFQSQFKRRPEFIIRAPGRVNLIGEHTDYNDGYVLPMAINQALWFAVRSRRDGRVAVRSLDFRDTLEFDVNRIARDGPGWGEYIRGTAWALLEKGRALRGWEGVLAGDIPVGAGLSSSAALELGSAKAFALSSPLDWHPVEMARIAQYAENHWVGVKSGIMDQTIIAAGEKDHALLIDCRTMDLTPVPLPPDTTIVIMDTMTRRGLVESAYNERREQCENAASRLRVAALRDVSLEMLEEMAGELDPVVYQRAKHVVTENERVLRAVEALQRGDPAVFGALMNQSHTSLRDDYEVSREELDLLVAIAQERPGCHGARMTGGGFGGCAVALVALQAFDRFVDQVQARYEARTGLAAHLYATTAQSGVSSQDV
jgi:galactokinase